MSSIVESYYDNDAEREWLRIEQRGARRLAARRVGSCPVPLSFARDLVSLPQS